MRKTNFLSVLFALMGLCAIAAGILLALGNRDAKPVLMSSPEMARDQITQTMDALCQGDYEGVSSQLYGTPDLGLDREAAEPVGALIWDAFRQSLSYELEGECYTTDSGLAQNVVIRGLDIGSVTANLKERSQALLEKRVEEAEDPSELYDENYDYREDVVMEVLYEATEDALAEDAQQTQWDVTVNLVYVNGQWWLLPESGLLEAISGGILS